MKIIDCNGFIGARQQTLQGSFHTAEDYIKYMDLYGIEKAFVYYAAAKEYDPRFGNMQLMKEIKDNERLLPVWVVMPHYTREFPEPNKMIEELKQNNVKLARIWPKHQRYSIANWNSGDMFEALAKAKTPVLVEVNELTPEEIYTICSEHKDLNIIITNMNYGCSRFMYPLIEKFPNLYLESGGLRANMAIEDFCKNFGAERAVFGTNMPIISGAAAVTLLTYTDISDEDKEKIAYKNLERLINERN